MADDTIQSISIGLGLNVAQLEADARDAKTKLDNILPKRQERFLTLSPRLAPNAEQNIIGQIDGIRGKAQGLLDKKPFRLTPKFTVTTVAARDLRNAVETALGKTPIRINVTPGKINKRQIQKDISDAIGTVPIALSWKWDKTGAPPKEFHAVVHLTYEGGGPPGATPGAGPGPGPGPTPGRGPAGTDARTDAREEATRTREERRTRAERRTANRAAHAAEREAERAAAKAARAEKAAANKAAHAAAQDAKRAERAGQQQQQATAAAARSTTPRRARRPLAAGAPEPPPRPEPPPPSEPAPPPPTGSTGPRRARGGAAGATAGGSSSRPAHARVSMDELRRGPQTYQYSPADLLAQELEKGRGTFAQPGRTSGTRGAGRSGMRVAGERNLTADEMARRDAMWQRHEEIAQHLNKVVARTDKAHPGYQRAREISNAFKSVKRGPDGKPDLSHLGMLLKSRFGLSGLKMATSYQGWLESTGRDDDEALASRDAARSLAGEALNKFGAESGIANGQRRIRKALDPNSRGFGRQPADIQLFAELGRSLQAESAIESNPDVVLKRRSVIGRKAGPTSYRRGPNQTNTGGTTRERLNEKLAETQSFEYCNAPTEDGPCAKKKGHKGGHSAGAETGFVQRCTELASLGRQCTKRLGHKGAHAFRPLTAAERSAKESAESLAYTADLEAGRRTFEPQQATPGTEPSPLPQAEPGVFRSRSTGTRGAGERPRPKQNMGAGPTPRISQQDKEEMAARQKAFFGSDFFKNFSDRMRPPAGTGEGPPGLEDKLKAMALLGNSPNEQAMALRIMRERGFTGRFNKDELARLGDMGLPIEGLAKGGKVKKSPYGPPIQMLPIRMFGEKGAGLGSGTNVATENSYAWKKFKNAQIRKSPWCAQCGMGRREAQYVGKPLTADHKVSQQHGGAVWDPDNIQIMCGRCNPQKGHASYSVIPRYKRPRRWAKPEGRADGGQVDALNVYRGGDTRQQGESYLRRRTSYSGNAYVTLDKDYAGQYTGNRDRRVGRGGRPELSSLSKQERWALADERRDRYGMIHEGVIPASKVAPEEVIDRLFNQWLEGTLGDEHEPLWDKAINERLKEMGYAAASHPSEIQVFDPRYLINRLAGPKGVLPRAGGGPVDKGKIRLTQISTPSSNALSYYENRFSELPYDKAAWYEGNKKGSPVSRADAIGLLKRAWLAEMGEADYPHIMRQELGLEGRVAGGFVEGIYRTGERGMEWYRSKSGRYDRPVGVGGEEIFVPPEDGEIIPNHKLPGRRDGGEVRRDPATGLYFHGTRDQRIDPSAARRQGFIRGFGEIIRVFVVNFAELTAKLVAAPAPEPAPAPTPKATPKTSPPRMGQQGFGFAGGGTFTNLALPIFGVPQGNVGAPRAGAGGHGPAGPGPAGPGVFGGGQFGAGGGFGGQQQGFGFAGAGPGAGAMGGAGPTGPKALSAEQRAMADIAAQDFYDSMRAKIGDIRAETAEQLQLTPVRALSVSIGQIFQTAFGGRADILARARVANRLSSVAERGISKAAVTRQHLDEAQIGLQAVMADPQATQDERDRQAEKVRDLRRAESIRMRSSRTATLRANIAAQGESKVLKEIDQETTEAISRFEKRAQRKGTAPARVAAVVARLERSRQTRRTEAMQEAEEMKAEGYETGGVATRKNRAQAQILGVAGIVTGTLAFTAAMQVAQVGIELLTKMVSNAADAMSNFAITTNRVAEGLAPAARAVPGAPRAGIAAQFAPLGLDVSRFPRTAAYAERLAGAQNLQQVIDIQRTENNLRARGQLNPNVVPGIGTGFNNGPLAMVGLGQFGQTPGALEQIAGLFGYSARQAPLQSVPWFGPLMGLTGGADFMAGRPLSNDPNTRAGAKAIAAAGSSLPIVGALFGDWAKNLELQDKVDQSFIENLDLMNERIQRTIGSAAQFEETTDKARLAASVAAFREAGNEFAGQQLANAGIALTPGAGQRLTPDLVNQVGEAAITLLPSRESLTRAMMPQLMAQLAGIDINAQRARQELIPTSIAMRLRTSPMLAPGTGLIGRPVSGATFGAAESPIGALGENAAASIDDVTASVTRTQAAIRATAQAGEQWLQGLSADGRAAVEAVTTLGAEIARINTIAANMQAEHQTEQMNRQMERQIRTLGDALGMAGEMSMAVRTTVGYDAQGNKILDDVVVKRTLLGKLQREQMLLGRENTRIELMQQQRQINFGLAIARIGVPGESPAERAANLAYNKQVAQEQQEAHDRAEDMFEIAKALENEGIRLNLIDARKDLQELSQTNALTIALKNFDEMREYLTQAQADAKATADTYITAAQQTDQAMLDAWLQREAQMNSFEDRYKETVAAGLAELQTQYNEFLNQPPLPGTSTGTGTGTGAVDWSGFPDYPGQTYADYAREHSSGTSTGVGGGYATGAWRTGNEYAQLHAGEMVIPANQAGWMRANMLGATVGPSGGGGVTIININNPTVRNDSDIDQIARRVEQVMNRRAAAVGLAN